MFGWCDGGGGEGMEVRRELERILEPLVKAALFRGDAFAWFALLRTRDEARGGKVCGFPVDWYFIRRVITELVNWKRVLIEKSRQMLMSWLLCGWAVREAVLGANRTVGIISRREDEAKDLVERCKFLVRSLEPYVLERLPGFRGGATEMKFENGSRILAFPSTEDVGRGYTFSLLIVDEAAFIPNLKELYESLMPAVPDSCQVVMCSTVGRAPVGLFYEMRKNPQKYGFRLVEIDWWEHPERDRDWMWRKRHEIGEMAWQREYERRWMAAGGLVFPELSKEKHWVDESYRPKEDDIVVFGFDPHPRKPSVGVWVAVNYNGTRRAIYEIELGREGQTLTVEEMASRIRDVEQNILGIADSDVVYRVIDPSGGSTVGYVRKDWSLEVELALHGLEFTKAPRGPEVRIEAIRKGLHGNPPLLIYRDCPRLWEQLRELSWRARDDADPKAELPSADFVDALGYALTFPISRDMFFRRVSEREVARWKGMRRYGMNV